MCVKTSKGILIKDLILNESPVFIQIPNTTDSNLVRGIQYS